MALILLCSLNYAQTIFSHERELIIDNTMLSKEVSFLNPVDNVLLSGTFMSPKTYGKIAIIIPGSGKDSRNSHYFLTQELLKNNIAVFRFDERGVGKSEGVFTNSIESIASDIISAVLHIKTEGFSTEKQIGLVSHSLGGIETILAVEQSKKSNLPLDFLVHLAVPVQNFTETTKHQIKNLTSFSIPNKTKEETLELFSELISIVEKFSEESISQIQERGFQVIDEKKLNKNDIKFWSYSHISLYKYQLQKVYKNIKIPLTYIIGSNDKYANATTETNYLKQQNNPKISIKMFKNLNHYLGKGEINNSTLYNMDPLVTNYIIQWIEKI